MRKAVKAKDLVPGTIYFDMPQKCDHEVKLKFVKIEQTSVVFVPAPKFKAKVEKKYFCETDGTVTFFYGENAEFYEAEHKNKLQ